MPCRPLRLSVLAVLLLAAAAPVKAQDLVGCQLVDGQLSCVPGVSADPQSQIRALRREIAGTEQLEGAVEQNIDALAALTLSGEATEGALLTASAEADALNAVPEVAFHWYRLRPAASQWLLITEASGPRYRLQPADVGALVMVVVSLPAQGDGPGSRRQASPVVGPVTP